MSRQVGGLLQGLLVASVLTASVSPAFAAPPPASAFGHAPTMTHVDMNPSGKLLAFAETLGDNPPQLVIFDLDARKEVRKINIGTDFTLREISWADDSTVLIEISRLRVVPGDGPPKKYEYFRTLALDVAGGPIRPLLLSGVDDDDVTAASMVRRRVEKPNTVVMSTFEHMATAGKMSMDTKIDRGRGDSKWTHNVFEVDTRTGKGKRIETGSQFTTGWLANKKGDPVVRVDWNPDTKSFRILGKHDGSWRELIKQTDGGRMYPVSLSADENALLAIGARGGPLDKLWSLPLDGSAASVLAADTEREIESVLLDPHSEVAVAATLGGANNDSRWIDTQAEARYNAIQKAFAGSYYRLEARSVDHKRVLVRVWGSAAPPVYYVVDYARKTADIVGDEYPSLIDQKLGEVRTISYKARDGYEIPAYLTLPPGADAKNLPLVVLPHGGPEARDFDEFDWWAQFIATRGYAVLQPQFRGSSGFGEAHRLAGRRQWGKLMQDDVTDGVKAMIAQGIADARRVCIVGWSYGGYAALAGAAFTPDLYACAASVNGVADLPMMLGMIKKKSGDDSNRFAYWEDHIGSAIDPEVVSKSPAKSASAIRAPILLVHGINDTTVPVEQSDAMARALQAAGKPVQYVKLDGDDHGILRTASRTRMLVELEKFLADHLAVASAN